MQQLKKSPLNRLKVGHMVKEKAHSPNRHDNCVPGCKIVLPSLSPKRAKSNSPKTTPTMASISHTAAVHENYSQFINKRSVKPPLASISPLRKYLNEEADVSTGFNPYANNHSEENVSPSLSIIQTLRHTPSKPSIYTSLAPDATKYGNDISARSKVVEPLYMKFTKSLEKTNRIKKSSKL